MPTSATPERSEAAPPTGLPAGAESRGAAGARLKSWALTLLKLCVSGGLIWLLASELDMADVARRFADVSPGYLALAFVLVGLQIALIAARWALVFRGLGRKLGGLLTFRLTLEGFFFNQALPSSIGGDAIRMMRTSALLGSPRTAIQSVLLDRFMGVLGLVLLVLPAQIWLQGLIDDPLVRLLLGGVVLLGCAAILVFLLLRALPRGLLRWRVTAELADLSGRALALLRNRLSPLLVVLSAGGQALAAVVFFVLALAIDLELSLWHALLLIPSALLATLIPLSIAGWGLREGAVVALLAFVGVAPEAALSLSLLFGLILLAISLPGGLLWVLRPKAARREEG